MKHEDKLEKFIREHQQDFDIEEPDMDLWNKIDKELDKDTKVIKINWMTVMKRAAAVLIISTVSILGYEFMQNEPSSPAVAESVNETEIPEGILPAEVREEIHYYSHKVNSSLTEFNKLTKDIPELNREVQQDLQELDEDMKMLKQDLQENLDSEEVIEAMIQNYRYKLQVLEEIMSELKEEKSSKDEQHIQI